MPKQERHTDKGSPPTIVYLSPGSSFFKRVVVLIRKGFQRSHFGEDVRRVTPYSFYYEDLSCDGLTVLNPLGPKSDQHQISPSNIPAVENKVVMRITDIITQIL